MLAQPGISLPASNAIGTPAEQLLLRIPDVASTGRRTGRAELDEHAEGVHYTEIEVRLKPGARPREAVMADIRRTLSTLPGVDLNIGQPISHRLDHLLSGTQAQVAVKLFGPDLDTLARKAAEIDAQMKAVAGVVDVSTEKQTRIPQIRVEIDRHAAAQYGLQVGEINQTLETSLNGRVVSQAIDGEKRIDILVRLDDGYRNSFKQYKDVLIDGPTGTKIPLGAVARVTTSAGPNQILRENVQRRIVIQANVAGRDLGSAVDDIRRAIGERPPRSRVLRDLRRPVREPGARDAAARPAQRVRHRRRVRRLVQPFPIGGDRAADHGEHSAGRHRRRRRRVRVGGDRCRSRRSSASSPSPASPRETGS